MGYLKAGLGSGALGTVYGCWEAPGSLYSSHISQQQAVKEDD